jgi:hypothetical protein
MGSLQRSEKTQSPGLLHAPDLEHPRAHIKPGKISTAPCNNRLNRGLGQSKLETMFRGLCSNQKLLEDSIDSNRLGTTGTEGDARVWPYTV